MELKRGFNTKAVHEGEVIDLRFGNVVTPIFQTSTFVFPNPHPEPYIDNTRGEAYLYTRWGNPTLQSFETKYSALEGARYSLSFSSGMSAITSVILSYLKSGDKIFSIKELYGQTFYFFSKILPKYNVKVDFLSTEEINSLNFDPKNYKLIYLESITNPTLKVPDLIAIGKVSRERGVPLIVDATFATPFNQRPLEFGAEVVVHSATKYISGHSDVLMGVTGTNNLEVFHNVVNSRKNFGGSPDPHQAYLALRGLKTLGLRMERHNRNALSIARVLKDSRKVKKVFYPGLEEFEFHEIARKVLKGYGGMVSFELKDEECSKKFVKSLRIPIVAASLGGVESLVTRPVETSHSSISEEERRELGISGSLVRYSVGIEDEDDLIEDIKQALDSC